MWRSDGLTAVHDLIAGTPLPPPGAPGSAADEQTGPGARRVLVHATGFRLSPYADVQPAGEGASRKLWHSSPGSSGR
jgi:error-prone DNA polymerase